MMSWVETKYDPKAKVRDDQCEYDWKYLRRYMQLSYLNGRQNTKSPGLMVHRGAIGSPRMILDMTTLSTNGRDAVHRIVQLGLHSPSWNFILLATTTFDVVFVSISGQNSLWPLFAVEHMETSYALNVSKCVTYWKIVTKKPLFWSFVFFGIL